MADVAQDNEGASTVSIASEVITPSDVAFRLGLKSGADINALSLGMGFDVAKNVRFNYAFGYRTELTLIHQITLSYQL